ncbi:phospho-N-acetylmuramoyl-pentapeptide-transferase [Lutispora thermophila]|uniref:Phospho-N-acetylmuramoyl-pentapeptide-transferase n=1 Tax=Lutispora thermophila DSM 19022 TaxID=1122184 RepID=A0A1M6CMP3_9FIRM|nr:phospho-N-acetylmuramoyl-pentapeptide-transferase [Lutispora thermophila]SHI62305.1 Phospho-N-acetylmuramoyl-pentapeptide-transferase [Lutispora thermophila DSM 19022]
MSNFFVNEYKMFIICIISSFVLALIAGPVLIPVLKRLKFGQNVRDDGPQSHLKKAGIPTIGGLIFIIPATIVCLSFSKDRDMLLILITTLLYGAIGFADDYIKIVKKRSLGLKAWQKIVAQLAAALFLGYIAGGTSQTGTEILVPFLGKFIDLGIFYIPFIVFIIVGTVNSVNLTDGLDGLAGGITVVVLGFFAVVALTLRHVGVLVFSGAFIGAILGFLRFNSHPAQVFMGDTGSLALGGAVVSLAVILKLPLFLAIVGAIYVVEALSDIIQVVHFKRTGKRIFKMAPIHHHFELSGWAESKIVSVFIIIEIILCLIGILAFNL